MLFAIFAPSSPPLKHNAEYEMKTLCHRKESMARSIATLWAEVGNYSHELERDGHCVADIRAKIKQASREVESLVPGAWHKPTCHIASLD